MWMISMKAVLDIVSQYCPGDDGSCSKANCDLREMLDEIEGLDETEVEPVKHGRWINKGDYSICTVCGGSSGTQYDGVEPIPKSTPYCPYCGARMDGDSE